MTIEFDTILPSVVPDIQVETDWRPGAAGLPNDKKVLLLMGQQLATGSLTVPTGANTQVVKRITSTAKAVGYYGEGSTLAVMCEHALEAAPRATIYAVAYKSGAAPGTAAQTVTLANNATGAGELKVWIMGVLCRCGIASGDTPTIIGDAIVLAINGKYNLPVTAANAAGTVTVTARNAGIEQNTIAIRSEVTAGIATTSTDGAAYLAAGTVAGDPTTQLAAMEADRYHLYGIETNDSTALGVLQTHVEAASAPAEKRWGMGIAGEIGNATAAQTLGNALDSYRMQVVWQETSDKPCYVLAAVFAGHRANYGPRQSLDDLVMKNVPAPYNEANWPNFGDIETNVEEGLVVLKPNRLGGTSTVVRSVVTRQTTPLSYRDHMIAEKSDYTDLAVINAFTPYKGKTLKVASPPGLPTTLTPDRATAILNRTLKALDREDILQGVQSAITAGKNLAEQNSTDDDRLDVAFEFYPTRSAHGIMCKKTYTTPTAV